MEERLANTDQALREKTVWVEALTRTLQDETAEMERLARGEHAASAERDLLRTELKATQEQVIRLRQNEQTAQGALRSTAEQLSAAMDDRTKTGALSVSLDTDLRRARAQVAQLRDEMTAAAKAARLDAEMQRLIHSEVAQAELVGRLQTELEQARDLNAACRPQSPLQLESNLQAAALAALSSQVHASTAEAAAHLAQHDVAHAELRGESAAASRLEREVQHLRKLDATSAQRHAAKLETLQRLVQAKDDEVQAVQLQKEAEQRELRGELLEQSTEQRGVEQELELARGDLLETRALLQKQQALSELLFGKLEASRQDSSSIVDSDLHLRQKVTQQAQRLEEREATCAQLGAAYDQVRQEQVQRQQDLDAAKQEVERQQDAFVLLERELMLLRTRHTGTVQECTAYAAELRLAEDRCRRSELQVAKADERVAHMQVLLKKKAGSMSPYNAAPIALRRAAPQPQLGSTASAPMLPR